MFPVVRAGADSVGGVGCRGCMPCGQAGYVQQTVWHGAVLLSKKVTHYREAVNCRDLCTEIVDYIQIGWRSVLIVLSPLVLLSFLLSEIV